MAVIWQPVKRGNPNRGVKVASEDDVIVKPAPADDNLSAILARLSKLEEENKRLKDWDAASIARNKKEIYKWPRHYAFSMWGWVPVISWTTKKMDNTKDLVFKNNHWVYESNHALVLVLADGSTTEVEVNLFNRDRQKTEPMPCSVVTNEAWETVYVFNTPDYGKISLLLPYLN